MAPSQNMSAKKTTPNRPAYPDLRRSLIASHNQLVKELRKNPPSFLPRTTSYRFRPTDICMADIFAAHIKLLVFLLNHTARCLIAHESRCSGTLFLKRMDSLLCNVLPRYKKPWKEPNELLKVKQIFGEAHAVHDQMQLITQQEPQYKEAWSFVRGLGVYVRDLIGAEIEASELEDKEEGPDHEEIENAFWENVEIEEGSMLKGVVLVWLGGKVEEIVAWALPGEDPIF